MRNSILIENKAYLQSFLNDNIWKKRYYHDFFPLKYNPTLTWDYLIADKGADVTADIVAYGTPAPEKGREIVTKKHGDVPAVRVKRIMDDYLMDLDLDIEIYRFNPVARDKLFDDLSGKLTNMTTEDIMLDIGLRQKEAQRLRQALKGGTLRNLISVQNLQGVGEKSILKIYAFAKSKNRSSQTRLV